MCTGQVVIVARGTLSVEALLELFRAVKGVHCLLRVPHVDNPKAALHRPSSMEDDPGGGLD